ncbi:hypothetical protein ABTX60_06760 [Streptomyces sp. NPDC126510]|uniref:hypothetical protein n=1 Tax=Streptomyces sp. NPDC126510 TaxID=3155317 RepID=UPI0033303CAF
MSLPLDVLIWIAENLNWWWLLVLAPCVAARLWLELRPTGKHRRPRPARSDQSAQVAAPARAPGTLSAQQGVQPVGEDGR